MTVVEAGRWYLTVECRNPSCRRRIAIAEADHAPTMLFDIQAPIEGQCPYCGSPGRWDLEEIRSFQAQERP
jgi:hypothetical protein